MITPVISEKRDSQGVQKIKYSLQFGKKLIKLYKGSGISDTTCVKIYEKIQLTLPGGFRLPVSLIRETITDYNFTACEETNEYEWLSDAAKCYLQSQMVAGQILDQHIQTDFKDNVCYLYGRFACLEMIGQVKNEEMIQR